MVRVLDPRVPGTADCLCTIQVSEGGPLFHSYCMLVPEYQLEKIKPTCKIILIENLWTDLSTPI